MRTANAPPRRQTHPEPCSVAWIASALVAIVSLLLLTLPMSMAEEEAILVSSPVPGLINASIRLPPAHFLNNTWPFLDLKLHLDWHMSSSNCSDPAAAPFVVTVNASFANDHKSGSLSGFALAFAEGGGDVACAPLNLSCTVYDSTRLAIQPRSSPNATTASTGSGTLPLRLTMPSNKEPLLRMSLVNVSMQATADGAAANTASAEAGGAVAVVRAPPQSPSAYRRLLGSYCDFQLWHAVRTNLNISLSSDPSTVQPPPQNNHTWLDPLGQEAARSLHSSIALLTHLLSSNDTASTASAASAAPVAPALFSLLNHTALAPLLPRSFHARALASALAFVDGVASQQLVAEAQQRRAGPRGGQCGDDTCDLYVETCSCSDCRCGLSDLTWDGQQTVVGHWQQTRLWGGCVLRWDIPEPANGRRFDIDVFTHSSFNQASSLDLYANLSSPLSTILDTGECFSGITFAFGLVDGTEMQEPKQPIAFDVDLQQLPLAASNFDRGFEARCFHGAVQEWRRIEGQTYSPADKRLTFAVDQLCQVALFTTHLDPTTTTATTTTTTTTTTATTTTAMASTSPTTTNQAQRQLSSLAQILAIAQGDNGKPIAQSFSNNLVHALDGILDAIDMDLVVGAPPMVIEGAGIIIQAQRVNASALSSLNMSVAGRAFPRVALPASIADSVPAIDGAASVSVFMTLFEEEDAASNAARSNVLDFSLKVDGETVAVQNLPEPIDILIPRDGTPLNETVCRFWNATRPRVNCTTPANVLAGSEGDLCLGDWDTSGVWLVANLSTDDVYVCRTSHLSTFSAGIDFRIAAPEVTLANFDPRNARYIYAVFGGFYTFVLIAYVFAWLERRAYDRRQAMVEHGVIWDEGERPLSERELDFKWAEMGLLRGFLARFWFHIKTKHNWVSVVWFSGLRVYPKRAGKVTALMATMSLTFGLMAVFAYTANQYPDETVNTVRITINGKDTHLPMEGVYVFIIAFPVLLALTIFMAKYSVLMDTLRRVAPGRYRNHAAVDRRLPKVDGKYFIDPHHLSEDEVGFVLEHKSPSVAGKGKRWRKNSDSDSDSSAGASEPGQGGTGGDVADAEAKGTHGADAHGAAQVKRAAGAVFVGNQAFFRLQGSTGTPDSGAHSWTETPFDSKISAQQKPMATSATTTTTASTTATASTSSGSTSTNSSSANSSFTTSRARQRQQQQESEQQQTQGRAQPCRRVSGSASLHFGTSTSGYNSAQTGAPASTSNTPIILRRHSSRGSNPTLALRGGDGIANGHSPERHSIAAVMQLEQSADQHPRRASNRFARMSVGNLGCLEGAASHTALPPVRVEVPVGFNPEFEAFGAKFDRVYFDQLAEIRQEEHEQEEEEEGRHGEREEWEGSMLLDEDGLPRVDEVTIGEVENVVTVAKPHLDNGEEEEEESMTEEEIQNLHHQMVKYRRLAFGTAMFMMLAGLVLALCFMGSLTEASQKRYLKAVGEFVVLSAIITAPLVLCCKAFWRQRKMVVLRKRLGEKEWRLEVAQVAAVATAVVMTQAMIYREIGRALRSNFDIHIM